MAKISFHNKTYDFETDRDILFKDCYYSFEAGFQIGYNFKFVFNR